jgi:hypothetical protein
MQIRRLSIVLLFLSALSFAAAGCRTTLKADGTPDYKFAMGELQAEVQATPQEVVKAATDSLEDLEITLVSSSGSGVDGKVVAKTSLDKKVAIEVRRVDEARTKLGIRVDTFGDQAMSRLIYERIKTKLE